MSNNKSYFECKRCFHKFYQLIDITRHLDKKKLCSRTINSYKYDDNELRQLSLVRIYATSNITECIQCNKKYSSQKTLDYHILYHCKNNNGNININGDGDVTINNVNNVNININLPTDFNDGWNTSDIDNNLKLILLLHNSKFTKTLENILENEVNLNVLIDNTNNEGLIFSNNKLQKMDIKDILRKSMDKLYKQLCSFYTDLADPNIFDINPNLLTDELNVAKTKYNNYKKDINIQNKVNELMNDIYSKKKYDTIKEINNSMSKSIGY